MKNFVTAALAWFNRLAPLPKLAVVVIVLLGLAAVLSPAPEDAAYGVPDQSPLLKFAEALFLLSIPITLLGAAMAALDFRTVQKQRETLLTGNGESKTLTYKPVPYKLAALVAVSLFLLYEIVAFSQYEHTYADSERPIMWSLFGNYLARRIIIFGMIASSILIVTNTVQRVRSVTRFRQAA